MRKKCNGCIGFVLSFCVSTLVSVKDVLVDTSGFLPGGNYVLSISKQRKYSRQAE